VNARLPKSFNAGVPFHSHPTVYERKGASVLPERISCLLDHTLAAFEVVREDAD